MCIPLWVVSMIRGPFLFVLARCARFIVCVATAHATEPSAPHWSFVSPTLQEPPSLTDKDWAYDSIDAFILAELETHNRKPGNDAPADTLIRRLHFDLIGLPPTAHEVRAFAQAHATDPNVASEQLVDRLLASPHFGERWGQHWLDVARYAESNGDDGLGRNATFPHAWRYRDYVIDAFNKDTPYDAFLQQQIAGDLLPATTNEERNRNLIATGFLALGTKPAAAMNQNFPMDVVDDQINVVCTAVTALSVACARCHDHKHDPVTTLDYYALAGIFTSSQTLYGKSGNEKLTAPPTPLHELKSEADRNQPPRPKIKVLTLPKDYAKKLQAPLPIIYEPLDRPLSQLRANGPITTTNAPTYTTVKDARLHGAFEQTNAHYSVSFWFYNEVGNDVRPITAYLFSRAPMNDKKTPGEHLGIGGKHDTSRSGKLFVFNGAGKKQSLAGQTVILPKTWNHVVLIRNQERMTVFLNGQDRPEIDGPLPVTIGRHRAFCFGARSDKFAPLQGRLAHVTVWDRPLSHDEARAVHRMSGQPRGPSPMRVDYAMGVRDNDKPQGAIFYNKGLTPEKNRRVPRRFLSAYDSTWIPSPAITTNQSGRLDLAKWLTRPDHPQTARVWANRVWLQLFGRGLVDTPDDFGVYGARPSHPQLLDHLAHRLVEDDWSSKRFIRALVLSRTYQLDSRASEASLQADPDNRLYGRHSRRRLDAESIRDRILSASGQLDPTPGRGSVIQELDQLINWPPGEASNLHQPSTHRSIYLCRLRHAPPPEIAAFDLPDTTCTLGHRSVSTLPTHALYLLNNTFVVEQAQALAGALLEEEPSNPAKQVDWLYQRILQRAANTTEKQRAINYILELTPLVPDSSTRWASLIQALFASNEFTTID